MRGRYAPSPTGLLHIGNARTALTAWLSVRSQNGAFIWRLEDLDAPRVVHGMSEVAQEDLAWLGLDWDEGPGLPEGHSGPYVQSQRHDLYEEALKTLFDKDLLFPCRRSRKDLQDVASAPHGTERGSPYPASFRPSDLDPSWFDALQSADKPEAAIRFKVHGRQVAFEDRVYGRIVERVDQTTGDFVLKRRDGFYAYQLAVVVDDLLMGINEVVRGEDLLGSTARQIQLIEALGGIPPAYAHVPLVLNEKGEKLSKRDWALSLRSLREHGVYPEQLAGYLAYTLGLLDRPIACKPRALLPFFQWEKIRPQRLLLPADLPGLLRRL